MLYNVVRLGVAIPETPGSCYTYDHGPEGNQGQRQYILMQVRLYVDIASGKIARHNALHGNIERVCAILRREA